jgi:hypothetical protein
MKTKNSTKKMLTSLSLTIGILLVIVTCIQGQDPSEDSWTLPFLGAQADHEGFAAWDADGTGPEPAASGHQVPLPGYTHYPFYAATADYDGIDPLCEAGAHLEDGVQGFPQFTQSLADNGFSLGQVQFKLELMDLGNDEEGIDWFVIEDWSHGFYYNSLFTLMLDGEPISSGMVNNCDVYSGVGTGWAWISSFIKLESAWAEDADPAIIAVGMALMEDLGDEEIRIVCTDHYREGGVFSGNGRLGEFWTSVGYLEKGYPQLNYQGFASQHQGMAGWNADGTGPEPAADGHLEQRYYIASRDYGDIDPDPNAAFGHLITGYHGFRNLELQMAYRGYSPSQFVLKNGISSLGEDVMGEDWGFDPDGNYWCNYYDVDFIFELDGETIIKGLCDTSVSWMNADPLYWYCDVTRDKPRDVSEAASTDAQMIAQAFFKDIDSRQLVNNVKVLTYDTNSFQGNGRYDGGFFNVEEATLEFRCNPTCTFVQCDTLGGGMTGQTHWTAENSPYLIDNDLVVSEDHTLVIDPGAEIRIRGPYEIIVDGNVEAIGDEDNRITFSRSNPLQKWDGFRYFEPGEADSSLFSYCIFEYGATFSDVPVANNSGGAFYIKGCDNIRFSDCIFRHNEALYPSSPYYATGGAVALWDSRPIFSGCEFYGNSSVRGGALNSYMNSAPVIEYCLFRNNYAELMGGALYAHEGGSPVLNHNTIVFNQAGDSILPSYGGAMYITDDCIVTLNENIIWGNEAYNGSNTSTQIGIAFASSLYNCYYNDIEFGADGIGPEPNTGDYENNIDADPEFCLPDELYFYPSMASPCATAGPTGSYIGAFEAIDCGILTGADQQYLSHRGVLIYPNPAKSNTVTLLVEVTKTMNVSVDVFNLTGERTCQLSSQEYPLGEHTIVLPTAVLSSGIYMVRVTMGKQVYTEKLIILR